MFLSLGLTFKVLSPSSLKHNQSFLSLIDYIYLLIIPGSTSQSGSISGD